MDTKIINAFIDDSGKIVVEYNGDRVLTTPQLAEVFGYSANAIRSRYNSHKNYFAEGEHLYKV